MDTLDATLAILDEMGEVSETDQLAIVERIAQLVKNRRRAGFEG